MKKLSLLPFYLLTLLPLSSVFAATGIQVGTSGKTYASSSIQCALNPVTGMAPVVDAGLYNPKKTTTATLSLNGANITTVTFYNPDAKIWLDNRVNTVIVKLNKRIQDTYTFDALSNQANICIPDTSGNFIDATNDLEIAASRKSTTLLTPGCALNPATGQTQPYVMLFNGDISTTPISYSILNVTVNNAPLTQLSPSRRQIPIFLKPGLNVISAANGAISTDYYVRDGGNGSCALAPQ